MIRSRMTEGGVRARDGPENKIRDEPMGLVGESFFFFWVLVYCAEAGRAYVTHYAAERRGAKGERDRKL